MRPASTDVDAYIASFPDAIAAQLRKLRKHVRSVAKDAEERIAYGIPTYKQGGNLFHFAGHRRHIGLYPGPEAIEAHREALAGFRTSKGAIQIPLDAPLPLALITRLIAFNLSRAEVSSAERGNARSSEAGTRLFRLPGGLRRHPQVESWFSASPSDLRHLAMRWFEAIRACGPDVVDLLHDGHPTACVGDVAFAEVNAFRSHVNVGFFFGATLADPSRLLQGTGRFMRHVKVGPGLTVDEAAVERLILDGYADLKAKLRLRIEIDDPGHLTKACPIPAAGSAPTAG